MEERGKGGTGKGRDRGGRGQCSPPQAKACPQDYFPGAGAADG